MEENELLDQEHVCASQRSHFEHKEQFLGFVDTITRAKSNEKEASEALSQLSTIVKPSYSHRKNAKKLTFSSDQN
jgi:hypothetical protein